MLPTLWPGDVLTIRTQSFEQVRDGDVVLFERDGRFFIHRILSKCPTGERPHCVTRGDAMLAVDAPVLSEELLGKVVSLKRDSEQDLSVPSCSRLRRAVGLTLGYFDRLRGVALRLQSWRSRRSNPNAELMARDRSAGLDLPVRGLGLFCVCHEKPRR